MRLPYKFFVSTICAHKVGDNIRGSGRGFRVDVSVSQRASPDTAESNGLMPAFTMDQLSVDVDDQIAVSLIEFLKHEGIKLTTNAHE
jgi:hypothetical protein